MTDFHSYDYDDNPSVCIVYCEIYRIPQEEEYAVLEL